MSNENTSEISSDSEMETPLKELKDRLLFRKSKKDITKEKPFKCSLCYLIFSQISELDSHKLTHFAKKSYKCDLCCLEFNYAFLLNTHKQIHKDSISVKCNICDVAFSNQSEFLKHKITHEVKEAILQVEENIKYGKSISDKMFNCKVRINTNNNKKPIKCSSANQTSTQPILNDHELFYSEKLIEPVGEEIKESKELTIQDYECEYCCKQFSYLKDLRKHQLNRFCENPKKRDLPKDHNIIHEVEEIMTKFTCVECGMKFDTGSNLVEHQLIHNIEKETELGVPNNNNKIKKSKHLRKELKLDKQFSCRVVLNKFAVNQFCKNLKEIKSHQTDMEFETVPNLIQLHHNVKQTIKPDLQIEQKQFNEVKEITIRKIECDYCFKKFSYREDLRKHELDCSSKSKKSNLSEDCKTNNEIKEKISKEYKCDRCEKKFSHRENLIEHQKSHTSNKFVKPIISNDHKEEKITKPDLPVDNKNNDKKKEITKAYKCDRCDKKFSHKENLIEHKNTHTSSKSVNSILPNDHKEKKLTIPDLATDHKKYNCNRCDKKFRHRLDLIEHEKNHSTNISVPISPKEHKEKEITKAHVPIYHKEIIKKYKCDQCDRKFSHRKDQVEHERIHSINSSKKPTSPEDHKEKQITKAHLPIYHKEITNKYKCDKCDKKYSHRLDLIEHQKRHTSNKSVKSNDHKEKNITKLDIPIEHKNMEKTKEYICDQCEKKFYHKDNLIEHLKNHSPHKSNQSFSPNDHKVKEITNPDLPIDHKEKITKNFTCDQCDKQFSNRLNLTEHQTNHSRHKPIDHKVEKITKNDDKLVHEKEESILSKQYECKQCEKKFSKCYNLKTHERDYCPKRTINLEKQQTIFECDDCTKTFCRKFTLNEHVKKHHQNKTNEKITHNNFKCFICNLALKRESELIEHNKLAHPIKENIPLETNCENKTEKTKKAKFQCDICEHTFGRKTTLRYHMISHSGVRPFKCDMCREAFATKGHLNRHKASHDDNQPTKPKVKCDVCDKEFTRKENLKVHRRTHTGAKPFQCHLCPKRFARSTHLTEHVLRHRGETPFKCEICDKAFARSGILREHELIHSEEKSFKCNICHRGFYRCSALRDHKATHNETKDFICELCGMRFLWKSNLTTHRKTPHVTMKTKGPDKAVPEKSIFECDVCEMTYETESELNTHKETHKDFDELPTIEESKRITVLEDILILPSGSQNNADVQIITESV